MPGGGISPSLPAVQIKLTFKEGGAFDFHTNFERIRERLEQAIENTGEGPRGSRTVNLAAVHLEELPAYEGPRNDELATVSPGTMEAASSIQQASVTGSEPMEPPPGYEEVQQQSVAHELEERLRRAS